MITEQDLQEAIAECQGERNPNANTCIKLAAYYTIRDHLFPEKAQLPEEISTPQLSYSRAGPPDEVESTIDYYSDTEFGRLIEGRRSSEIWPIVDELVSEAVQVTNPRLYAAFLRKIQA